MYFHSHSLPMRYLLVLLILIIMAACGNNPSASVQSPPPPVPVDVIVAAEMTVQNELMCNGSVLAGESVELHAESSGRLIQLTMKDAASVTKGTLLAKINDAELQARLRQETTQLTLAKANKARFEKLLAVSGVNQADYDNAVSQVATLEASVDITKALIEKTEVRAPFDGTLGLRMVSQGAYITPQTALGSLQENGPVKIDFTLPEQYASHLKTGATVTIIGSDEQKLAAYISAFDPQINPATRNIKARAILKSGRLIPGAYVKVILSNPMIGIIVPTPCVIPDAISSKVLTVKGGKGVFVNVKSGLRTEGVVEITEGLSAGDTVIVTGVLFVRPNAAVKVRSVQEVAID